MNKENFNNPRNLDDESANLWLDFNAAQSADENDISSEPIDNTSSSAATDDNDTFAIPSLDTQANLYDATENDELSNINSPTFLAATAREALADYQFFANQQGEDLFSPLSQINPLTRRDEINRLADTVCAELDDNLDYLHNTYIYTVPGHWFNLELGIPFDTKLAKTVNPLVPDEYSIDSNIGDNSNNSFVTGRELESTDNSIALDDDVNADEAEKQALDEYAKRPEVVSGIVLGFDTLERHDPNHTPDDDSICISILDNDFKTKLIPLSAMLDDIIFRPTNIPPNLAGGEPTEDDINQLFD